MPLMTDKYDAKEERKNLYAIDMNYKKTKLDGSFQRYGGYESGSGWNKNQGEAYLESLIQGTVFNIISF